MSAWLPRWMKLTLQAFVLVAAVTSLIVLVTDSELRWPELDEFRWEFVVGVLLAHLLCNLALAESLRINLGDSDLSLHQAHAITLIRTYSNLAFPIAGTGYSAFLLARHFKVSVSRFGAAAIEWTAHQYLAAASLGLFMVLVLDGVPERSRATLAGLLGLACAGSIAWMIVSRLFHGRLMKIAPDLQLWRNAVTPWCTLYSLVLQLLLASLRGLRLWSACLLVGLAIGADDALILSVAGDMGSLVNLTPNGVGIREVLATISAKLIDLPVGTILIAVLVERILVTLVTISMGLWYSTHYRFDTRHLR